jgi:hypothetical protein
MPPSPGGRNALYAGALVALVGVFACAPLLLKHRAAGNNLTSQDKPLTGSQIMRGAYMNTGSRDAGADKDWRNGVYIGAHKGGAAFDPTAEDIAAARARLEAAKARAGLSARS